MRIRDDIASEFNDFSVNYTSDMIKCVPHYLKLIASFTDYLPEQFRPQTILDLGCGNGNVTSKLLELFPKSNYTLLDASQDMLILCKNQFKGYNIEVVQSYFQEFDFMPDHYDLIVAGFSFHHCTSDEKKVLFQKINNALKKGGLFSCSDLMINKRSQEHSHLLKDWQQFVFKSFPDGEKWKWLMEHYDEFDIPDDPHDQIEWLEAAHFKNIKLIAHEQYWAHIQAFKN